MFDYTIHYQNTPPAQYSSSSWTLTIQLAGGAAKHDSKVIDSIELDATPVTVDHFFDIITDGAVRLRCYTHTSDHANDWGRMRSFHNQAGTPVLRFWSPRSYPVVHDWELAVDPSVMTNSAAHQKPTEFGGPVVPVILKVKVKRQTPIGP